MKIISTLSLALFLLVNIKSQVYELSLEHIINNSDIIVECYVASLTSRFDLDNRIHTLNSIEIEKTFKGDLDFGEITVKNWGGTIDNTSLEYTHMPRLSKGGKYILFLNKGAGNYYEIYAGLQGVIRFGSNFKSSGKSYFKKYNDIYRELLPKIRLHTGDNRLTNIDSIANRKCIELDFFAGIILENDSLKVSVDTRVKQSDGVNNLNQIGLSIKYDTLLFGSNIVNNDIIDFEVDAAFNNYILDATDASDDKIFILLRYDQNNSSGTGPTSINDDIYIDFLNVKLTPVAITNEFVFDIVQSEILDTSEYFVDANIKDNYDCISYTSNFDNRTDIIQIESVDNSIVAAGVGEFAEDPAFTSGSITIRGLNFGMPSAGGFKPNNRVLGFSNAGPSGVLYCFPPKRDIISWNDTIINVRVPSIDSSGSVRTYSGTGQVVIYDPGDITNIASTDTIKVKYAVANTSDLFTNGRESETLKMVGVNDSSGYDIYFTSKILSAIPGVEESFERALDTWRCNTGFNAVVKDSVDITDITSASFVDFIDTLPAGLTSTLAVTRKTPPDCDAISDLSYQDKFEIFVNKYIFRDVTGVPEIINWYTGVIELDESLDTFPNRDFQTVALHELGHANLLLHTNNSGDVMFKSHEGTKRELVFANDLSGGRHSVNISSANPHCLNKMEVFECLVDNVDEKNIEYDIDIFPNPTSNRVFIEFLGNGKYIGDWNVTIRNSIGQVILKDIMFYSGQANAIDISFLANGMYSLALNKGNTSISRKIIKQ